MTIPYICLFSKEDGTPELMKEYGEALLSVSGSVRGNEVAHYEGMHHGWMGARADFRNEGNVREFEWG